MKNRTTIIQLTNQKHRKSYNGISVLYYKLHSTRAKATFTLKRRQSSLQREVQQNRCTSGGRAAPLGFSVKSTPRLGHWLPELATKLVRERLAQAFRVTVRPVWGKLMVLPNWESCSSRQRLRSFPCVQRNSFMYWASGFTKLFFVSVRRGALLPLFPHHEQ